MHSDIRFHANFIKATINFTNIDNDIHFYFVQYTYKKHDVDAKPKIYQ